MATLTSLQVSMLKFIHARQAEDPSEKEWAPVMSGAIWGWLGKFPHGLVETHQRFAPIVGGTIGVGFARLTDAGRAAIAERGE